MSWPCSRTDGHSDPPLSTLAPGGGGTHRAGHTGCDRAADSSSSAVVALEPVPIAAVLLGESVQHDLRHAYATLMLEDGEGLAVISRLLGHANLSTTADVYAHLTPAMLERSAARMDGILGRRKDATG